MEGKMEIPWHVFAEGEYPGLRLLDHARKAGVPVKTPLECSLINARKELLQAVLAGGGMWVKYNMHPGDMVLQVKWGGQRNGR